MDEIPPTENLDKKEPLLVGKVVTPLPVKQLFVLSTIIFAESFSITMIFPFLATMVLDFGIVESTKEVGYYAGWIASSFNLAQFFSSFIWGRLSDMKGRKPILLIGLIGSGSSIIFFGFSRNLWWAIVGRSLNGLLNGNIGVAKTYLSEITDDTNSGRAFSIIGLVFGVGLIIGPALSGWTIKPHEKFPDVFPVGSFFHTYPYLIPCFVSALVSLTGFIVGMIFLKETRNVKQTKIEETPFNQSFPESDNENILLISNKDPQKKTGNNEDKSLEKVNKKGNFQLIWELLKSREVMVTSLLYTVLGFTQILHDELISLWSVNEVKEGGINFGPTQLGTYFMVQGIILIAYQTLLFPKFMGKFGTLKTFRFGSLIAAPGIALIPLSVLIAPKGKAELWTYLVSLSILKVIGFVSLFTSVFLLINHSTVPSKLGAANGFAQSMVALARAVGPTIGAYALSWSLTNNLTFPLNYYFLFLVLGLLLIILFGLTFFLKEESINFKKKEIVEFD
eukprot:TRINITY_DN5648_c0_g1_i1.p1 TRINITY_DN5648_c0_g1~~TRINITY_DN5648_c0_g1_i1.p1  ORF type:complete len:507 (-),score=122.96 TRINITY_DN5648_c0_g1_i1:69-1589(-)